MIKKLIKNTYLQLLLLVSSATLVVFMMSTNPSGSSFVVSFVPLLLIWIIVFCLTMIVIGFFKGIDKILLKTLSSTLASIAMLLIMFSALGQLSFFDISLILSLAVLGVFYFRRSWPN